MDLGRVGIWTYHLNFQPTSKVRDIVAELEALGYGAIWVGEAAYREPLANAAVLLSATSRMVVATGIANIWVRDPFATLAAQLTLAEAYPERFLLGLGVSHTRMVEGKRGHHYRKPFTAMRTYLDAMDRLAASYRAVGPVTPPPRVLAALGPKMLALAAERAQGAHPYLVPPEHTAKAREQLGHDRWLLPEQGVVLETNPTNARAIARRHLAPYLGLPNYTNNLRRLGFTDDDLAAGGSDRLVDALFAWGDVAQVARRVQDHIDAGADHVCIQVFDADPHGLPMRQWKELATALL
jgi:probable F420-dependent oxidoreductase